MTLAEIAASNIVVSRQALGLTQAELAERVRVTHSYISMVERGERSPSLEVLARVAGALGVTLQALLSVGVAYQRDLGAERRVQAARMLQRAAATARASAKALEEASARLSSTEVLRRAFEVTAKARAEATAGLRLAALVSGRRG